MSLNPTARQHLNAATTSTTSIVSNRSDVDIYKWHKKLNILFKNEVG